MSQFRLCPGAGGWCPSASGFALSVRVVPISRSSFLRDCCPDLTCLIGGADKLCSGWPEKKFRPKLLLRCSARCDPRLMIGNHFTVRWRASQTRTSTTVICLRPVASELPEVASCRQTNFLPVVVRLCNHLRPLFNQARYQISATQE